MYYTETDIQKAKKQKTFIFCVIIAFFALSYFVPNLLEQYISLVMAGIFLYLSLSVLIKRVIPFTFFGRQTLGTIKNTHFEKSPYYIGGKGGSRSLIFTTEYNHDNKSEVFEEDVAVWKKNKIGEKISIVYDKRNPEQAMVGTRFHYFFSLIWRLTWTIAFVLFYFFPYI